MNNKQREKILIEEGFKKNKIGDFELKVYDGKYFFTFFTGAVFFEPNNKYKLFELARLIEIARHIIILEKKLGLKPIVVDMELKYDY